MSSVSRPSPPTADPPASSALLRRLTAEWHLLERLAERNPGRLTSLAASDLAFHLTLRGTPAFRLPTAAGESAAEILFDHRICIDFPYFFPAAPMELSLRTPVAHPNVHPETGFVCLWDTHRVSNTVEHALHKTVAILGWRLFNAEAVHVMQPDALQRLRGLAPRVPEALAAPPLLGVAHDSAPAFTLKPSPRRRLS